MTRRRLFSIGTTAAAAFIAAFLASQHTIAQGQPEGRGGRGGPMMGRGSGAQGRGGLAFLDLTDDQRTKITSLQRATRDQAAPLTDELELTRKTLHRELFADKRDNAKITSLSARIATLERQLADLHVKTTAAIADLLTPEQREKMRVREPGPRGPRGALTGPPRPAESSRRSS